MSCAQTDRPQRLNCNDGVMSRRSAARAARLAQAASLGGATQHDLRTFWTSCRLCRLVQSCPSWRKRDIDTDQLRFEWGEKTRSGSPLDTTRTACRGDEK